MPQRPASNIKPLHIPHKVLDNAFVNLNATDGQSRSWEWKHPRWFICVEVSLATAFDVRCFLLLRALEEADEFV